MHTKRPRCPAGRLVGNDQLLGERAGVRASLPARLIFRVGGSRTTDDFLGGIIPLAITVLFDESCWIVVLPPAAAVVTPPVDFFRIALLKPGVCVGEHEIQAKMVGRG